MSSLTVHMTGELSSYNTWPNDGEAISQKEQKMQSILDVEIKKKKEKTQMRKK